MTTIIDDTLATPSDTERDHEKNEAQDNDPLKLPPTPWQLFVGWFLIDVSVNIVVLNLAAEIVSTIIIDHFSISIFVAIVLTLFLNLIQYLEHKVQYFFCVRLHRKCLGGFFMWLTVFLSKFVILWVDEVIFGEHVQLGKFWSILILSIVLMLCEKLTRFLYIKLGDWDRAGETQEVDEKPNDEEEHS
jgi:uncharacterized membrane protein YvlD (DUF360 family)